jgi:hypothetical protein
MNTLITATWADGTTETYSVRRGQHYQLVQALRNDGATVTGVLA